MRKSEMRNIVVAALAISVGVTIGSMHAQAPERGGQVLPPSVVRRLGLGIAGLLGRLVARGPRLVRGGILSRPRNYPAGCTLLSAGTERQERIAA